MSTQPPLSPNTKDSKDRLELNPKIFAHIHQDRRLVGSHLQGSTFGVTARYILETLEYFSSEKTSSGVSSSPSTVVSGGNAEIKETVENAGAIAATLMNNRETKETLEKVSLQFQTLMDLESQITVAGNLVRGLKRLYWGSEKEFFDKPDPVNRWFNEKPLVLLDAQNKPVKFIYSHDGKNIIVDIKDSAPKDLLDFIAANLNKKIKEDCEYNNADIWHGHPLVKWLELLYKANLEKPHVKSLIEFQEKYIAPTAQVIFEKLEKQDNILMPGGWAGIPGSSGHAMIYQFIKQKDGSYNFVIYNTGAGIEHHQAAVRVKDKHVPLMAYNITDNTKIKAFITELLTPQIAPKLETMYGKSGKDVSWEAKKKYDAGRVYKIIKDKIPTGSKKIENPISAVTEKEAGEIVTQGQLSGTCAIRVLMPLLKVNMGSENFRTFHSALDLKSIQDYFETQKQKNDLGQPNNLYNPMVRRQLLQSIRRSAIRTRKLLKRKNQGKEEGTVISPEQAEVILRLLSSMDSELRSLPTVQKARNAATKTFSLDQFSSASPVKMASLSKEQGVIIDHDGSKIINDQELKTDLEKKTVVKECQAPIKENYQNKPLSFLRDYYETVFKNDSLGYGEKVLFQIENLFLSFPLQSKEELEAYFKNLSEVEAREALTYVQMILRIYGKNCGKLLVL